jgi:hypothetical protein
MRKLQITTGAIFLTYGAAMMIGKKKYVQWSCENKARFLPKRYETMLKEFADAGPDVYFYWGLTNALAGGLMLVTAIADHYRKNDA